MMTDALPHVERTAARAESAEVVPPDAAHTAAWPLATWLVLGLVVLIGGALLAHRYGPSVLSRARSAWASLRARRAPRPATPNAEPPARPAAPPARSVQSSARPAERPAQPTLVRRLSLILIACMSVFVVGVLAVALALNFEHGRALAELNGETDWRACVWPLAVDGLLISAGLVKLVRQLLNLPVGARTHVAFIVGIVASTATNIVLALHSDLAGWQLAEHIGVTTWPTLALYFTHEMGIHMIAYLCRTLDVFGIEGPNPDVVAAEEQRDQAAEDARAARALVAELREEHGRQVGELRDELASARQSAESDRADADRTIKDLRADLNETCEQMGALDDEVERLRADAQNRTSTSGKRTADEWEQVRHDAQEWARNYVREYGEIPKGPQVAAQACASERWANNVLKTAMDELLDLRNAHERTAVEVG